MKKYVLRLLLSLAMLCMGSSLSIASTLDEEEATHLPLVGKMSMEYLRKTSDEIHQPAILRISVSPLLGGNDAEDLIELNSSNMPAEVTLEYVSQFISQSDVLRGFLADLKAKNVSQACVKVSLSFDGIRAHREKINGFDVISLVQ